MNDLAFKTLRVKELNSILTHCLESGFLASVKGKHCAFEEI